MQSTLRTHILFLEDSLQQLKDSLTMQRPSAHDRGRTQALISIAHTALSHYKHALDLEQTLQHLTASKGADSRKDGPPPYREV